MTHLMNIEKAGYFPLPTELIPIIASYIIAPAADASSTHAPAKVQPWASSPRPWRWKPTASNSTPTAQPKPNHRN